MLPTAAVTGGRSGRQVQYSAPFTRRVFDWIASGLGSRKLLKNMFYKKLCCYGTCKSDSLYSDGKIWTVFVP